MAETPELRASDADRERAAELLRRAGGEGRLDVEELGERLQLAFTARTRAELERLVADVVAEGSHHEVGAPAARLPVRPGEGGSRWLISIMSGTDRRGHWRLAPRVLSLNIMGGSDLDLNEAELSAQRTEVRVIAIMGGADIRVPDGLNVEVSQLALMGGNDIRLGPERPDPGGPTVHLKLFSLMGGIDVKRGRRPTRDERRAAKQARRDERRLDRGAWFSRARFRDVHMPLCRSGVNQLVRSGTSGNTAPDYYGGTRVTEPSRAQADLIRRYARTLREMHADAMALRGPRIGAGTMRHRPNPGQAARKMATGADRTPSRPVTPAR